MQARRIELTQEIDKIGEALKKEVEEDGNDNIAKLKQQRIRLNSQLPLRERVMNMRKWRQQNEKNKLVKRDDKTKEDKPKEE